MAGKASCVIVCWFPGCGQWLGGTARDVEDCDWKMGDKEVWEEGVDRPLQMGKTPEDICVSCDFSPEGGLS